MTDFKKGVFAFWNQYRMLLIAMITILILYYPVGVIHEFGHYLVGLYNGSTCVIHWWLAGQCEPLPQPFMLYWALGGIFGTIASFSIVALKRVRTNKGILLGVLTLGVSQFVNFTFETFFHFAYINSPIATILMASIIAFFLLGCWAVFNKQAKDQP